MKVTITLIDTPEGAVGISMLFDPPAREGQLPTTQAEIAAARFIEFLHAHARPEGANDPRNHN